MPRANIDDRHAPGDFHVFNRGFRRRVVFVDNDDRDKFLELLKRHLSKAPSRDSDGRAHKFLGDRITLISANLMSTHYHLVLRQKSPGTLAQLMNAVIGSYSRYFRKRHRVSGKLFDGPYRTKRVRDIKQLRWLIGYVHDNHPSGLEYRYSTHRCYVDSDQCPGWIDAAAGLRAFGGREGYLRYLDKRDLRNQLAAELF